MFLFIVQEENVMPWDLRNASVRPPAISCSDVSLLLSNANAVSETEPYGEQDTLKKKIKMYLFLTQDIVRIFIRRGGIDVGQSHKQWLSTISQSPNVISMSFVPITSLLSGVRGNGFLSHAVNLYLRCEYAYL